MKRWLSSLRPGKPRSPIRTHEAPGEPEPKEAREPTSDPQSSRAQTQEEEKEINTSYYTGKDENIIQNPCFEDGLNHWSGRGCNILLQESLNDGKIHPLTGKFFAAATDRRQSWNGIQQVITDRVQRKIAYDVSATVRILGNDSVDDMRVTLWVKLPTGQEQYIGIAKKEASDKEWVHLHGKFLLNSNIIETAIFIEGPTLGTNILVDSIVVKRVKKSLRVRPPGIKNVLFGANIIENSDLKDGLRQWSSLGSCTLRLCLASPHLLPSESRDSKFRLDPLNDYIFTTNRTEPWMGPSQIITDKLQLDLTYQVASWVRVGSVSGINGPENINITLHADNEWVNAGQIQVFDDKWYALNGFLRIKKQPSKAVVYIQGPSAGVDLMVHQVQIFPVDRKARFKHLKEKTDKARTREIILKFVGRNNASVLGASVKVRQLQNSFPLGSSIDKSVLQNEDFVDFFLKNFNWTAFGNESKWYHTEPQQGKYNYKDADEMLDFCERHGIQTRGHCIFWEVEDTVQPWVQSLNRDELLLAVKNHLRSLVSRYKGKFRHYDVNNEMLHGSFYQDRLGNDIRAYMFRETHMIDPTATLFVNDYNVEDGRDAKATPEMYIEQILDLQERGAPVGGIGLQGHVTHPVGEVICATLDKLAILGLPIWFTELDVVAENEYIRADDLEVILREAYAHPAVDGVMLWGFWELFMWRLNAHLVDADGEVNEAGKRFLALKQEWLSQADGHIDEGGEFKFRGYEGKYSVEITTSSRNWSRTFSVEKGASPQVLSLNI